MRLVLLSDRSFTGGSAQVRGEGDGKLEPHESGGSGRGEPAAFIRQDPVLAVFDADGDGKISEGEIRNATEQEPFKRANNPKTSRK